MLQTVASTPGGVAILTIDNTPTVTPATAQPGIGLPSPAGPDEAPPIIVDLGTLVTATVIAAVAAAVANEVPALPIVPPGPIPPAEPGQIRSAPRRYCRPGQARTPSHCRARTGG